ncbi:MAG: hypothetical protein V1766_03980 [Pseudomonadota bacterium]
MEITHKNCLIGCLSHWQSAMKAREAVQNSGTFVAGLPQPVGSFTRREYGICLMLELLDDRLKQIEHFVKDVDPGKDIGPFSKGYSEAMTFIDTIYIFLRSLLDDVSGIIEYIYKSNNIAGVPKSFSDLLKKAKAGRVPEDLICILRPCQDWFPKLKKDRDDIVHDYETNLIGFVMNPRKGGWTSIQFSGKTLRTMENGGVGIRTNLGLVLANYQSFIDDLLDLWDRKFLEWYGIVSSRNSRPSSILEGRSANMLLWAVDFGGYTDEDLIISRR